MKDWATLLGEKCTYLVKKKGENVKFDVKF